MRDTLTIFRVENAKGLGPYVGGYIIPADDSATFVKWPLPYEDGLDDSAWPPVILDPVFGFASRVQLFEWFPVSFIRSLVGQGYGVNLYLVPREHVLLGRRQVIFARARALSREPYALDYLR